MTQYTIRHNMYGTPTEYTTATERNIRIMIARCKRAQATYTVTTNTGAIYAQG